ncbi:MAG: hypothetical protein IH892_13675 [Planctomycetes bacterium]|nr:hypothetical protein [Planctomycetota bacterium]
MQFNPTLIVGVHDKRAICLKPDPSSCIPLREEAKMLHHISSDARLIVGGELNRPVRKLAGRRDER